MLLSIARLHSVRSLIATTAVLGSAGIATAAEKNDTGAYIGAGLGEVDVTIDNIEGVTDAVGDLSADDSAWKAFFGWRFNRYFSLETDYIDLGTPGGDWDASGSSGDYTVKMSGFAGYAIGTLPLGIFELSGKVGYYFHDLTLDVDFNNIGSGNGNVVESDNNGEAWVYGIGAGVTFIDHINAKLEYEMMDIEELNDVYTLWLTAAWRF